MGCDSINSWSLPFYLPFITPLSFIQTTRSTRFHWSSSIGKPHTTQISSVKTYRIKVCQLGHHLGSTFTRRDQNGQAYLPHRTRLWAVHSCNSCFFFFLFCFVLSCVVFYGVFFFLYSKIHEKLVMTQYTSLIK